jgi:RimJ/RimL family protein N-acetyltransferase
LLFELNGIAFGQVRFDLIDENYEIDYSIDKQFRNKGLGSRMLKLAIDDLKKEQKANNIIGKVKNHNIASKKIFLQIGFKEMSTEIIEGHCYEIFKFTKE